MSYPVTGIQSNTAGFAFPATEHASGGVISAPLSKTAADPNKSGFQATDATKAPAPNNFVAASAALTATYAAAPVDTVTLSTVDKVKQLRGEGEGDTVIATTLNLSIKEVDSDLHLSQAPQHVSFTVAPIVSSLSTSPLPSTESTGSAKA